MNVKLALLLLSVIAVASADFYIATFFSDKDCKDANGGYVKTETAVRNRCTNGVEK